jgi:penicillin-binding protein 1C
VLPNSPSLIHPGRNRDKLISKRNSLLKKLLDKHKIDSLTYELALAEPIPDKPKPLPDVSPHLLFDVKNKISRNDSNLNPRVQTTIKIDVQKKVNKIIRYHTERLMINKIFNAAAIVAEIKTGNVLAYVGNTENTSNKYENWVNIINAPRSSGSILKPILYATMLTEGEILPKTIIPDIPINIGGFSPKNFDEDYDGAIPADRALARSINIPAVRMLRDYKVEKFYNLLKNIGITTLDRSASNYGLSLILGGAEVTLWDMAGVYASMARSLNSYPENGLVYNLNDYHPLTYLKYTRSGNKFKREEYSYFSNAALWLTFKALIEVERPEELSSWKQFSSSRKIAWKTGTSFGFRDGWAIGVNKEYVVAVWAGNADGEGRTGLTGITAAAPILFDIFNTLPYSSEWFEIPQEEMTESRICSKSGYRASEYCETVDTMMIPTQGLNFESCPYHQIVHLSANEKFRVSAECEPAYKIVNKPWFILPPAMEYYYKNKNHDYRLLPPLRSDCVNLSLKNPMEFIYPRDINKVFIPADLDGNKSSAVFEVAHRNNRSTIYWHLDDSYLGKTQSRHAMPINAGKGNHIITLVDEDGNLLKKEFKVLN